MKQLLYTEAKPFLSFEDTCLECTCLVFFQRHHVAVPLILGWRVGLCSTLQEQNVTLGHCLGFRMMVDDKAAHRPWKLIAAAA